MNFTKIEVHQSDADLKVMLTLETMAFVYISFILSTNLAFVFYLDKLAMLPLTKYLHFRYRLTFLAVLSFFFMAASVSFEVPLEVVS